MRISVTFRHTESTDALKEYANQKLSKVKKYLSEPIDLNVVLSVEKFRHNAEVTLTADRNVINCREETEDMYSAIDKVAEKLERQVKKAKGRIQTKRTSGEPAANE
jgi:putative sigma-54 modulation protein